MGILMRKPYHLIDGRKNFWLSVVSYFFEQLLLVEHRRQKAQSHRATAKVRLKKYQPKKTVAREACWPVPV